MGGIGGIPHDKFAQAGDPASRTAATLIVFSSFFIFTLPLSPGSAGCAKTLSPKMVGHSGGGGQKLCLPYHA